MRSSIQTINGFSEIGKLHLFFDTIFRKYIDDLIGIIPFAIFLSVGSVSETLCCVKGIPPKNAENFRLSVSAGVFCSFPLTNCGVSDGKVVPKERQNRARLVRGNELR